MATNLALDDRLIEEARRAGKHKTKKEAVSAALEEYIRRRKQLRILEAFGNYRGSEQAHDETVGFVRTADCAPARMARDLKADDSVQSRHEVPDHVWAPGRGCLEPQIAAIQYPEIIGQRWSQ